MAEENKFTRWYIVKNSKEISLHTNMGEFGGFTSEEWGTIPRPFWGLGWNVKEETMHPNTTMVW